MGKNTVLDTIDTKTKSVIICIAVPFLDYAVIGWIGEGKRIVS